MNFVVFRCTVLATFILFSQISPAFLCTFIEFQPGTHIPGVGRQFSAQTTSNIGDCLKLCFETSNCFYAQFINKNSQCGLFDEAVGSKTVSPSGCVFYQLDRDETNTSCPTVEKWIGGAAN